MVGLHGEEYFEEVYDDYETRSRNGSTPKHIERTEVSDSREVVIDLYDYDEQFKSPAANTEIIYVD